MYINYKESFYLLLFCCEVLRTGGEAAVRLLLLLLLPFLCSSLLPPPLYTVPKKGLKRAVNSGEDLLFVLAFIGEVGFRSIMFAISL